MNKLMEEYFRTGMVMFDSSCSPSYWRRWWWTNKSLSLNTGRKISRSFHFTIFSIGEVKASNPLRVVQHMSQRIGYSGFNGSHEGISNAVWYAIHEDLLGLKD